MKTKLYVLYGGKSVEHEVSLKTAYTVILSLDESKFEIFPIYITRDGIWTALEKLNRFGLELNDLIAAPRYADAAESIGKVLVSHFALPGRKVVLPLLHGSNGEDGTIQGMMELLNVPYVGNGVLSSALTLDKAISKQLLAQAGINQVDYLVYRYDQWGDDRELILQNAEEKIGYPCYVKPASLNTKPGSRSTLGRPIRMLILLHLPFKAAESI
ncbi:hypothetical protein [Paenibacillus sp. LHD-38]|uniref:hypothetical protein n=1 Tax=Paenibacillus sp. LHD-38 TaxID=3072143 RepID=UPI00280E03A7|nr:hypothetical protein [Paenibacillus sp. LHD-38]MDQ8733653.1 hypothetical protein [Paenibacillus sp. LHD-38]